MVVYSDGGSRTGPMALVIITMMFLSAFPSTALGMASISDPIQDFTAGNPILTISYHPDGERAVFGDYLARVVPIERRNPSTDDLIGRNMDIDELNCDAGIISVEYSPDGQWLAVSCWQDATVVIMSNEPTGVSFKFIWNRAGASYNKVAWHPDSRMIAIADGSGVINVLDIDYAASTSGSAILAQYNWNVGTSGWYPYDVAFSPDGEDLAVGMHKSGVGRLAVIPWTSMSTGSSGEPSFKLDRLQHTTEKIWDVDWSPDGTMVSTVSHDGLLKITNVVLGSTVFNKDFNAPTLSSVWTADGRHIAVANMLTNDGDTHPTDIEFYAVPSGEYCGGISTGNYEIWDFDINDDELVLVDNVGNIKFYDLDSDDDGYKDYDDDLPQDPTDHIDSDDDGKGDLTDVFPLDPTETSDRDGDGLGDNIDPDDDNDNLTDEQELIVGTEPYNPDTDDDGVKDGDDTFPLTFAENADTDGDGIGNNADDDDDGDGLSDIEELTLGQDGFITDPLKADTDGDKYNDKADVFPLDPVDWRDTDNDGVGDVTDKFDEDPTEAYDSDGDGVGDNSDAFPDNASETSDLDGDGIGDNRDPDADGDGYDDIVEMQYGSSFLNASDTPSDLDGDLIPDLEDNDIDGDNLTNSQEKDKGTDPLNNDTDKDGSLDSVDQFPTNQYEWRDHDNDGVGDNADWDPFDPNETADSDNDGVGDNRDRFPNDANETVDTDSDGVGDNGDAFPADANETTDSDGDGVGDNEDPFPYDENEWRDTDRDGLGDNSDYLVSIDNNAFFILIVLIALGGGGGAAGIHLMKLKKKAKEEASYHAFLNSSQKPQQPAQAAPISDPTLDLGGVATQPIAQNQYAPQPVAPGGFAPAYDPNAVQSPSVAAGYGPGEIPVFCYSCGNIVPAYVVQGGGGGTCPSCNGPFRSGQEQGWGYDQGYDDGYSGEPEQQGLPVQDSIMCGACGSSIPSSLGQIAACPYCGEPVGTQTSAGERTFTLE